MSRVVMKADIGWDKMLAYADAESDRMARAIAVNTLAIAVATAPRRTGNLAASHYIRKVGNGYEVGNSAPYAKFVAAMPQSSLRTGRANWLPRAFEEAIRGAGIKVKSTGLL